MKFKDDEPVDGIVFSPNFCNISDKFRQMLDLRAQDP